mmetsp:Transcript_43912/g.115981  ORF Transcript_43912/g.115981 Transcript_43912/m.115981 type:complete len:280 (+) Transcript_43912:26-865(+)
MDTGCERQYCSRRSCRHQEAVGRQIHQRMQSLQAIVDKAPPPNTPSHVGLEELRADVLGPQSSMPRPPASPKTLAVGVPSASSAPRVCFGGAERPVRLDRSDAETEALNSLVREVRHAVVNATSQEISRRAMLVSLDKDIDELQTQRMQYSLQVPGWRGETWRSTNMQQRRSPRQDSLHFVAPEQRGRALRNIEREHAAWAAWKGEEFVRAEEIARPEALSASKSTLRGSLPSAGAALARPAPLSPPQQRMSTGSMAGTSATGQLSARGPKLTVASLQA